MQLTDAGRVFLDEARRTLAQAEDAVRAAQRAQRGEIDQLVVSFVGSATGSLLPEVLQAFRTRFPAVELVLHEITTAQHIQALHDGRVQVGFVRPPREVKPGRGSLAQWKAGMTSWASSSSSRMMC